MREYIGKLLKKKAMSFLSFLSVIFRPFLIIIKKNFVNTFFNFRFSYRLKSKLLGVYKRFFKLRYMRAKLSPI